MSDLLQIFLLFAWIMTSFTLGFIARKTCVELDDCIDSPIKKDDSKD